MSLYNETKNIMEKYNIRANKSLGQNFLVDQDSVLNIVESALIEKDDLVIEIGPGLGTLTKELLDRANKVICIELDKNMIQVLEDRFKLYDNIQIINDDILKVNLNQIIEDEKSSNEIKKVKIVANLPYYITTPIVMSLLENKLNIDEIIIMVQKEVAERLIALPGSKDCGAITYAVNYFSTPEKVCDVSSSAFIPIPKVESMVIKLRILKEKNIKVESEKDFFNIIKAAFMQRRKTLLNALTNANIASKENLKVMFAELELSETIRGEKLTLEDYQRIYNYLKKV